MACSGNLAVDRTILPLSLCFQSTPAPADQVGHLRFMCGRYHQCWVNSANPSLLFSSLWQAGSLYQLILQPAEIVVVLIVPISIGLAILRYRLWDIDIIIRRTPVYGTLTVLLALIYFGLVIALQSLVQLLTGTISGQPLVIVASTLAIAALFQPLRRRIQRMIDRRFYRRKYDAVKTLAAFSATLRHEVDLNRLSELLVAVVEETMQPAHVSLWLCPPKRSSEQTTRALPIIDTVGKA